MSNPQAPAITAPRIQPDTPPRIQPVPPGSITLHPRAGQIYAEPPAMPQTPVINKDLALARMGGDKLLLAQLAEFFLVDAPALLREFDAALAAQDADAVRHAAHSLKGLGANFEALGLVSTARQIEVLSQHGDLAGCQSLAEQLREEHDQVIQALRKMLEQNGQALG